MKKTDQFANDVRKGLTSTPKRISSKYFYDERGSKLFQQIMKLNEYYLTEAEKKIFQMQGHLVRAAIQSRLQKDFKIFELGAGDATKTEILLQELEKQKVGCTYHPADIDLSILNQVENRLDGKFAGISVKKIHGYNKDLLLQLRNVTDKKVLLFLGSNIGNYPAENSQELLELIGKSLNPGDLFLLGLDRKKNPRRIIQAYDDPHGITKEFNLNLLHRINRELDGNFPVDKFIFYPTYNVERGEVRSYLIAKEKMRVSLRAIDLEVDFSAWEYIHTEISRKYDRENLEEFASIGEFNLEELWTDPNEDFWLVLFEK